MDKIGLSFIHLAKEEEQNPGYVNRMSVVTKNRETETFEQNIVHKMEEINTNKVGKLQFFAKLKNHFGDEDHLLMANAKLRQKITQPGLSSHKLEIKVGRHKGIDREERTRYVLQNGKNRIGKTFSFRVSKLHRSS